MKYAGIGSRETPQDILDFMEALAGMLAMMGYQCRSGGAPGADTAFYVGARIQTTDPSLMEVILPWNGFNGMTSAFFGCKLLTKEQETKAMQLASQYHPAWDRCTDGAKKLHARNGPQVLGMDLDDPIDFMVCWTKDGQASGGTGQAMRIAMDRGITIYNLYKSEDRQIFIDLLKEPK